MKIEEIKQLMYEKFPYTFGKTRITYHDRGVHMNVQLPFGHPLNYERVGELMDFLGEFEELNDFCACRPCHPGDFGDGFVTYGIVNDK